MGNPVLHFEVMADGDIDALRRFYTAAFDWKINANNPMNYGLVETGKGISGGIGKPMGGPSFATFYVYVDDLQAALDKIESLGGSTMMPPMEVPGQHLSIAMFKDPAGVPIGLVHPHAMAPGRDVLHLEVARTIDAPRDLVFATWTDPKSFDEWWGPNGMRTPECEMDLRPGGAFRTVMRDPQGTEYRNGGVFLEVAAPERLVFTDAYEPGWKPTPEPFMTAVMTFDDVGGGKTRVTARALHRSYEDRVKHEQMGFHQGWGESLDRFAACVARRRR
jgi:uncharacterized protein YndB with AHSA1/START domain/predicted enzyme related to lactoylglutathione lyase